jgi:NAD+ kinase
MRIFVLGNGHRPGVPEEVERLVPFLRRHCDIAAVDLTQQLDLGRHEADIALVLGGDGSILRAGRQMEYRQVPVLGINLGKLGFLADLSLEEACHCLPRIIRGEYGITRHLMYECVVEPAGEPGASATGGSQTYLGLNEIVVRSGPPFHLIDVELDIDGEQVATFSGDGVIVSTPVGSTAQNLSAGGPILRQDLQAFVITPFCPHTLTCRPLVDSADRLYTLRVCHSCDGATLIIDGQETVSLTLDHKVTVRRAPVEFQLIKVRGKSYYQTLRDKLHWGSPPAYRREP